MHNPVTNSMFMNDFTEFMSEIHQCRMKTYILGEFNLHIGNAGDQDTQVFENTLEAMGLVQHVDFSTHKCGNILDLVFNKVWNKVDIISCTQGPFILDHKVVIEKLEYKRKIRSVRVMHEENCQRHTR